MLLASGSAILNGVLLASAIAPLLVVGVLCRVFFRAARRHDEAERAAERAAQAPQPGGGRRAPSSSAQ